MYLGGGGGGGGIGNVNSILVDNPEMKVAMQRRLGPP